MKRTLESYYLLIIWEFIRARWLNVFEIGPNIKNLKFSSRNMRIRLSDWLKSVRLLIN